MSISDFWKSYNELSGNFLSGLGNYFVNQEVNKGYRNPIDKSFINPLIGTQTGMLDNVNSASTYDFMLNNRPKSDDKSYFDSKPGYVSVPVNKPEYINADLAKAYGMDIATAYQEALANTAHQREIKDLQSAGLNPVLSARYSGASGVSGASVASSASGFGSGSGSGSGSEFGLSKLISGAALLAGIVAGIATKNPQVTYSISSATKIFSDIFS